MPLPKSGKPLVVLIAAACAVAAPIVMKWEGKVNRTYLDPINIPTACWGHTGPDVKMGQLRTDTECRALLNKDLLHHAEGIARCTPEIFENAKIAGAATSLSYNIGINGYCKSTAARLFRAGNYRDGCVALGRFVYAGKKKLRGLVNRRAVEVAKCLEGAGA